MDKLNVLILDDHIENIDLLKLYINKYNKTIDSIYTATTIEQATALYLEHEPDILLLDVELGNGKTSFALLEKIPYHTAEIIFITSHKEYAVKAINTSNVGSYLVKPVKPEELIEAIAKAEKKITTKEIINNNNVTDTTKSYNILGIATVDEVALIKQENIVYLEADGRYTTFYLKDGCSITAARNIGKYIELLDPAVFFRIHHKYVVNINLAISINRANGTYCQILNNKTLPIAKRRTEALNKFIKAK